MFKGKKKQTNDQPQKLYHILDTDQVFIDLDVNHTTGLSTSEAERRLTVHGTNEMRGGGRPSAFKILIRQLSNLMTLILIAAIVVAFVIKDWVEA
ncbi:P-type ATPase, partial [Coemansia sp. RSA 2337]